MTGHTPRKRFGQHFLHDQSVIRRIVESLAIRKTDTLIEIGPGQGALTEALPKAMEHLYLIEIDRDLAPKLEQRFALRTNVTVINQDILKVNIAEFHQPGHSLRLVGNLPYNISTPLFFHLAQYASVIEDMTFMVQKEVADRLVAAPGNKTYGRLTLSAGLRFGITKLFDVGAGAFKPPPKVQSSIIRLIPHTSLPQADKMERFDALVKTAFSQRRKTLKKSLDKHVDLIAFVQCGIDPRLRPEVLSIADFLKLADAVTIT